MSNTPQTPETVKSETALATPKAPIQVGKAGLILQTFDEMWRFATAVAKTPFVPKGMESPEAIMIAVQFGAEVGLTPMSALQSLAIVNGRPSIYGDAALALVRASGLLETYQQSTTGEGDQMKAIVRVKRKDETEIVSEFSVADAKRASLWGKAGPWSQYPTRMLMWRARGFALRDAFGDILRGLHTAEEAGDEPPVGFEHAKQVNEPVKPARKKAETLPAETKVLSSSTPIPTTTAPASGGAESPVEKTSTAAESVQTPPGTAQPSSTPAADKQTTTEPVVDQPDPAAVPLLAKIRDAQQTYGFKDEDVVAFAKERKIVPKGNTMALADFSPGILTTIVDQLPKLVEKFVG